MDFGEVYTQYFGDVYRYVLRPSGEEHTAEEVTSQTFFKALHGLDRFRGECDLRTWLCQIAKNCYLTHVKNQGRVHSLDDPGHSKAPDPGSDLEAGYVQKERLTRIRSQLHSLPEPYKEVFMWRVFAELCFKEIGAMYGKSDNWACVTYHRARKMLQSRLEEEG